jgi:hypothetical protein
VGSVSESLQTFLQQRLATIEQIEIVLLLRSDSARSWSATEVATELRMPPESAAMRLFLLASSGMILFEPSGVPRYRSAAADAETEALLGELAEMYASDRNAVAAAIGAPPDPIRSFADAFKLKK